MIDERKEENAAMYALDLLEGAERAAFEAELARNPELKKLVAELKDASAGLALTARAPAPSPALRDRILKAAAETPQTAAKTAAAAPAVASSKVVAFPKLAWFSLGAAAVFAVASVYTATQYMALRAKFAQDRELAQLAQIEIQSLKQQLEAERIVNEKRIADLQRASDIAELKIAKLAQLNRNSPEAVAIAVWNPLKQQGVLTVEKLPLLQANEDYQLWVVDPRYQNPVSGGVFTVRSDGTARITFQPDQPISAATHFAISRERKGGVPKAEGPIIAAGAL
jgi:anti-sigma-K factor RskA